MEVERQARGLHGQRRQEVALRGAYPEHVELYRQRGPRLQDPPVGALGDCLDGAQAVLGPAGSGRGVAHQIS